MELMSDCRRYGCAAGSARSIACSNCGIVMPLNAGALDTLRRQAVEALAAMERRC